MTGRHDTDAPDGRTHILPAVAGKAARLFGIPAATLCGRLSDARPADPDAPLCGTCQERQDAMTAPLDTQEPAPEVDHVRCSRCGGRTSNDVPGHLIVRAFVECPECITAHAPEPEPEWRTEYRATAVPHTPLAVPPLTHDEALADVRAAQERRGGRVETRRVADTPWTTVPEPEARP